MTQELSRLGKGFKLTPRYMSSFFRDEMDRMGRLFDEFFGREGAAAPLSQMWGPAIDISETEDKVIVKAELPGIDPAALDISVSEDILTIKGEKKEEKEEKGEYYSCCERQYGEFSRSVGLPTGVNKDTINAAYHNGVLKIEMQKMPQAKRKKISVKVE